MDKLLRDMGRFYDARPDMPMPVSYVMHFLAVAGKENRTVSEIARSLGSINAVTSRILLELGQRTRRGQEGLGLIEAKRDLEDMRSYRYRLTAKGRRLIAQLETIQEKSK